MKKVVIFGAGKRGKNYYYNPWRKFDIVAVLDNNPDLCGKLFENKIPIIGIDEYMEIYKDYEILITMANYMEAEKQLSELGIENYRLAESDTYHHSDVNVDTDICHGNWISYLSNMFNKEGIDILEIGSRNVTGNPMRKFFSNANYIGFDYYTGENVDVVGDAHELSKYFEHKFDLIFSSAVFEHLAMPWKVSTEIIKLLKMGGAVFVETHYSYSSHERPWHFFQFSENALDVLFPEKFGMQCVKKSVSNLIEGKFSEYASDYLVGRKVGGLYCHSEYFGKKVKEIDRLSWDNITLSDVAKSTEYPKPKK
ncbi:MAG: methyltransferase domain-containing protein [Clostridiales bacterium]|nr:methyltransferase domain-containing protein [Clostridiales bacterium]